jgi:hypothetical protein
VALKPGCDERSVCVRPVFVEFGFGEGTVATRADGDANELGWGHSTVICILCGLVRGCGGLTEFRARIDGKYVSSRFL